MSHPGQSQRSALLSSSAPGGSGMTQNSILAGAPVRNPAVRS